MSSTKKCKFNQVLDKTTKNYRCCKNNKSINNYCLIHAKSEYNDYAIKIQSAYKGFYIRKKLKIYFKLPREIQRKIIWHMNTDIYQRHFFSSISKLIYKRYKNFYENKIFNKLILRYNVTPSYVLNNNNIFSTFIDNLMYLIYLSNKYHIIIDTRKIVKYLNFIKIYTCKISLYMDKNTSGYKIIDYYNKYFV